MTDSELVGCILNGVFMKATALFNKKFQSTVEQQYYLQGGMYF
jgi:hypothetical protein